MERKLYRSRKNKSIAGVCGGIAAFFKIDVTIVRLIWALAILCAGTGLLAYIVCAFVIPEEPEALEDDYVTVE